MSGMPLQINVSKGSVSGWPAMYQMMRASTIPGKNIMLPMTMVRRVRMAMGSARRSRRCASHSKREAFGEGRGLKGVERVFRLNPTFSCSHHSVSDVAEAPN